LSALLLAGAAPACSDGAASSLEPGAPVLATRTDQGNVREPFFITADNPCTPAVEAINLEGTIHGIGSTWDNGHVKTHYNVSLTGADANGVQYHAASTGNGKGVDPATGLEDVVITTEIISQGGSDNFVMKMVLHLAADGSVQVDKTSGECRG
jgi:hypothetical protein